MKRRNFMKLSAAAALGTAVAAMAPAALAADPEQTNGTLKTTVDRKTAAMGVGEGKTFAYDPEDPYLNVNVGLFRDVPVTLNGETAGTAVYYLPDGMDPWAPAAIILTPDHTTAKAFANSLTGRLWCAVAQKNRIGIAFFEPENGGVWNLTLRPEGRDDAAALDSLYQLMRKKGTKLKGAFSMDKSHTALVGYREGGAAALLFGARWASDFSSICAVEATEVPAASLAAVGGQYVLPFPGDTTRGVQEEAIEARTVDTPVWFIRSAAETTNRAALEYYLQANQASAKAGGVYPCGRIGSASEVRVTEKTQCPDAIWSAFSGQYKRFMAMQLPGRVAKAEDFARRGYDIHEEWVNGELRRWMVYVPSSYTGSQEVPLVLVMHGYTASMYAIAEESRWYDVAEQNGFIVVFAQGLVRPADRMGNIPTAMWLAGPFAALAGKDTDPDVDLEFIGTLLDRMEHDYAIDKTRIYATGHSNGSLMTWAAGSRYAGRFAAIAPVGYMHPPLAEIDPAILLPAWAFLGEYDSAGVPELVEDNATVKALQGWNQHNAASEQTVAESTSNGGAFVTKSFVGDQGVPLVQYTVVKDTPHVYLQEESTAIWKDFFSRYSRGTDGTLYYQGAAVTAGQYQPDPRWYSAK